MAPATTSAVERRRAERARADAVHNRRRLVDAVGTLLARGEVVSLSALADEAGLSRSTCYRNFSEPSEAIEAYVDDFISDFERAATHEGGAPRSIEDVTRTWGELVGGRSHALVHVRSAEGFLARVRRGEPIISRIHRILHDSIGADGRFGPLTPTELDDAAFLWNLLLDPREILDLAADRTASVDDATRWLGAHFMVSLAHLAGPAPPER